MANGPTEPRWLIVVRRDKPELFETLRQSFESDPRVTVIRDRRNALVRPKVERRRAPESDRAQELWEDLGLRLIHQADDLTVYEAPPDPRSESSPPGPGAR